MRLYTIIALIVLFALAFIAFALSAHPAYSQLYCGISPIAPSGCHYICLNGQWVAACGR